VIWDLQYTAKQLEQEKKKKKKKKNPKNIIFSNIIVHTSTSVRMTAISFPVIRNPACGHFLSIDSRHIYWSIQRLQMSRLSLLSMFVWTIRTLDLPKSQMRRMKSQLWISLLKSQNPPQTIKNWKTSRDFERGRGRGQIYLKEMEKL
jgi:hypothetical protein